jgi:CubicO group peptidase (beta-lactamase class C family)
VAPVADPGFASANRAFDDLARANSAVTMTVVRDGLAVLQRASGTTIGGAPATSDSPMVVASVGKLLTALMIARLHDAGAIDVDAPFPWAELSIAAHPDWSNVTTRELLAHTSGMPVAREAWFDGGLDCAAFLPFLLAQPPTDTRGRWTYSNGNYCALGLLVEHTTGQALDQTAQTLVFDALDRSGAHLTTGGDLPTDVGYELGTGRLSRLGGAGTFVVSTDDMSAALATVTPPDLRILAFPGVFVDQYGWGHTGTVDGAVSCAWVLEGGRTVVAATVAGGTPQTGGRLCDRVVPAVADGLGTAQGLPDRFPP